MARNYKELRAKMTPEMRAAADSKTKQILAQLALDELREARKMTQEDLAEILHVNQAAVSKIENRVDMYVSTLRRFVEAMGGELVINAAFPDGIVRIKHFEDIAEEAEKRKKMAAVCSVAADPVVAGR